MADFPAPAWVPAPVPTLQWTLDHLRKYLPGEGITVCGNGTFVVWLDSRAPTDAASTAMGNFPLRYCRKKAAGAPTTSI
jgi:hypothetical protein